MRYPIPSTLAIAVVFSSTLGAQNNLFTLRGTTAPAGFGLSVSELGDVNKDGYADILLGVPDANPNGPGSGRVLVMSGRDGTVLRTIDGKQAYDSFGRAVSGAGDVNRDSYPDIIAATYKNRNSVLVFSGRDGTLLYTYSDPVHSVSWFGYALSGVGDTNLDGYDDFAIGAAKEVNGSGPWGSAYIYSGKDGKLLRKLLSAHGGFGGTVSGAGDVNRDGYADVLVGSFSNAVEVRSGRDGKVLHTFRGSTQLPSYFGQAESSVSGAGDVNNDGYADVIIGDHQADLYTPGKGYAQVFSGKDGTVLHTFRGDLVRDGFGGAVSGAGDVNGDLHADVIVGAPRGWPVINGKGYVRVFSGKDGKQLAQYVGDSTRQNLGAAVSGLGDVNGDGKPDFIATYGASQLARVYSGAPLSLTTNSHLLSISRGGTQSFELFAGLQQAGKLFWMVGSLTGTAPGIVLRPGLRLPLNFDAYTQLTISAPNTFLVGSLAKLSATGNATAELNVPPGLPAAVGTQLHHAYVAIDPIARTFDFVSNPVPLTMVR